MSNITSLTEEKINSILESNYIGRIGCSENEKPYIVPITYYFDKSSNSIFTISNEGMKVTILRKNPHVCFEVEEIEDMTTWSTVIVWGKYEELSGTDAKHVVHLFTEGVKKLINKNKDATPTFLKDISNAKSFGEQTIIARITLSEKTGRSEYSKKSISSK